MIFEKKLRNKIVNNFITDVCNVINRFFNLNLYSIPDKSIKNI
jgi:hypothetical protein